MAHESKHPKAGLNFPRRQYWLDKTKPKQAKLLLNFIILFNGIFYCLQTSITASATSLIFSLFVVASAQDVPFGVLK